MNDSVTAIPTHCPKCGDSAIFYRKIAKHWDCQNCDVPFDGSAPVEGKRRLDDRAIRPKAIFFSYGHDENKELVKLFMADLKKRHHEVWFDEKDIGNWDDWKGKITRGIDASHLAIAFISKHAMRDPGVCRNEIAIAMNRFGKVYPILLEAGVDQDIPITIREWQWQDLSKWKIIREGKEPGVEWNRWYEEKLLNLIEKIEGDATLFSDETRVLSDVLQPASFTTKITQHVPGFIGREWIFDAYKQWVDHQPESRIFWIKAGPGVGKSAIAANLAHRERAAIAASWFCDVKSSILKDPNSALKSIAFQLALRCEDYRVKLLHSLGLYASTTVETCEEIRKELAKKNTQDLFLSLLAEPMAGLIWREHKLVVVIDALDEATDEQGNNRITELIGTELSSLPEWIGFVVTSRPEAEVVNRLGGFKPFAIDAEDPRNVADLRSWYAAHLGRRSELSALSDTEQHRIEDVLIERSGGMILYLKMVEQGFRENSLTVTGLEQLQSGLPGLNSQYLNSFQQQFGCDYEQSVKPLLRLLLAACGPLPEDLACEVIGWNSEKFISCRNRIGSYAIETAEGYELFHKTLGEWLIDKSSGLFHLDRALGRQMIADVLFKEVADAELFSERWRRLIEEWLPTWLPQLSQRENPILLTRLANVLLDASEATKAKPIIEHAVAILEKTRGPEHIEIVKSLDTLANVLLWEIDTGSDNPDFAVAETIVRRALRIREGALGPEHPDVGRNLRDLADQLHRTGRHAEAEPLYRRSLQIAERAQEPDESHIAGSTSLLARTMENLGNYGDAETLFRRALAITARIYDPEFSIKRRNNLADLLCKSGNYSEAEQLYRQSLVITEKNRGLDHKTRETLEKLISLLEVQGQTDAAWIERRQQLDRLERANGAEHQDTLRIMQNLAVSLRNAGRLEEAEPLQREAMVRFVRVYGKDSLETANAYSAIGALLKLKGELTEAETYYLKALAIRERELGPDDEKTRLIRRRLEDLSTADRV